MNLPRSRWFLIGFLLFSSITLLLFYKALLPQKTLPIYAPSMVNPALVDSTVQHVAKHHRIADFSFVNQNGETITQEKFAHKIYVADFFFTRCQTICPKMSSNMCQLQEAFKGNPNVLFLSHSVTPEADSVSVLKTYAKKLGVRDNKWDLVTGDPKTIFYLARKSYLAVKTGNPTEWYNMVHTENFILVDKNRRIRGFYDGTKQADITQLKEDIQWLSDQH
ncbi:MAG: hypothetical protein CFE24_11555 [Flavobacterium sp. BFFFF2]|nr:MAG: hypothetical protein CFE24_11555 [Flavobacterium sp. BFFFF2]